MKIEQAAKIAFKNKTSLPQEGAVGCYYCLSVFAVTEISTYTDNGQTAICPKCNIDSVIPATDQKFLESCQKFWFLERR
jgi:uncharacterized paraquat-inducible protein A